MRCTRARSFDQDLDDVNLACQAHHSRIVPSAEVEKLEKFVTFKKWHASQLNEAEWANLLFPGFLFLHATGVSAPIACLAGSLGGPLYFWPRVLIGNYREGYCASTVHWGRWFKVCLPLYCSCIHLFCCDGMRN